MDIQLKLERTIEHLGFQQNTGKWGAQVLSYLIIATILIINSSLFIIYNWYDVDKRIQGFEAMVLYLMCFMYFLVYFIDWKNSTQLIEVIKEGLYKFPYHRTKERLEMEQDIGSGINRLNTFWFYAIWIYITILISVCILILICQVVENLKNLKTDNLILPQPFYFPENYKSFFIYLIALLLQAVFFVHTGFSGYAFLVSAFGSIQLIEGELKLLRQTLEDMKDIIDKKHNESQSVVHYNDRLDGFLTHIIDHHQNIYRKAQVVNKSIKLGAFSTLWSTSAILCTNVYSMAKRDDTMIKIQEGLLCVLQTFCLYCYSLMGERISVQDEKLSKELFYCPWIDKPKWFRKSLYIMMTRTSRTIEIKSSGLYALNLRNVSLVVRAAYSYYNVLMSFTH